MSELGAMSSVHVLTFEWQSHHYRAWMACLQTTGLTPARLQSFKSLLHRDELAALGENAGFARQRDYVLGRLAARMVFLVSMDAAEAFSAEKWQSVRILSGVFGQPVLYAESLSAQIGVSISHHDGRVVALAHDRRHPMALDVERVAVDQLDAFAQMAGYDECRRIHQAIPGLSRAEQVSLIWTCKEALGKAMGCGLTVPQEFLAVEGNAQALPPQFSFGNSSGWRGSYRHCPQFAWYAWLLSDSWLTIAAPSHSRLLSLSVA